MWRGSLEVPGGEVSGVNETSHLSVESSPSSTTKQPSLVPFIVVAIAVVIVDQLSKLWVRHSFFVGETKPFFENWLDWTHSKNAGAAWGMLSGQRWLLVLVSLAVGAFVVVMAREFAREPKGRVLSLTALGLIFGGAIGNLIDRILFGVVTDFIDLGTPIQHLRTFPIFNIADSALTIGVILLLLHFLLHREASAPPVTTNPKSNASDSI